MVCPVAATALSACGAVLLKVLDMSRGLEYAGRVDKRGLDLEDILATSKVGAPTVLDIPFELSAGVAIGDEAGFSPVDLKAGPIEAAAFGNGSNSVVNGLGHDVFGIGLGLYGLLSLSVKRVGA